MGDAFTDHGDDRPPSDKMLIEYLQKRVKEAEDRYHNLLRKYRELEAKNRREYLDELEVELQEVFQRMRDRSV